MEIALLRRSGIGSAAANLRSGEVQGAVHVWTQLPAQQDAEQPLTVDEWFGDAACDVAAQPGAQASRQRSRASPWFFVPVAPGCVLQNAANWVRAA